MSDCLRCSRDGEGFNFEEKNGQIVRFDDIGNEEVDSTSLVRGGSGSL